MGRRIAAALVDILVLGVVFVVVGLLFGDADTTSSGDSKSASIRLNGSAAGIFFGLVALYYLVFEGVSGQTLGKRLFGLRVRSVAGTPASPRAIVIRTLLRVVDVLPLLYLVGFISVMATGSRAQRLGDVAAKTAVGPA